MSVYVRIEYRQPDPSDGGKIKALTHRELDIFRIDREGNHGNIHEREYEYAAADGRGRVVTFWHRYGDDLSVLVGRAGAAFAARYRNL